MARPRVSPCGVAIATLLAPSPPGLPRSVAHRDLFRRSATNTLSPLAFETRLGVESHLGEPAQNYRWVPARPMGAGRALAWLATIHGRARLSRFRVSTLRAAIPFASAAPLQIRLGL